MPPSRFDTCLQAVLQHEGGFVDDPVDRGGRTNQGITQGTYDSYRSDRGLNTADVKDITQGEVKDIYFARYWTPLRCAQMPVGLDRALFDAGVNSGTRRAGKWLQVALGLSAADIDGVIGQKTLHYVSDAVTSNDVDQVITRFMEQRRLFLQDLILRDPRQQRFARGWANRCDGVEQCAMEDRA
jgi:lysozyme family protein